MKKIGMFAVFAVMPAAPTANVSRTDSASGAVPSGSWLLRAACPEKAATGSRRIRTDARSQERAA